MGVKSWVDSNTTQNLLETRQEHFPSTLEQKSRTLPREFCVFSHFFEALFKNLENPCFSFVLPSCSLGRLLRKSKEKQGFSSFLKRPSKKCEKTQNNTTVSTQTGRGDLVGGPRWAPIMEPNGASARLHGIANEWICWDVSCTFGKPETPGNPKSAAAGTLRLRVVILEIFCSWFSQNYY